MKAQNYLELVRKNHSPKLIKGIDYIPQWLANTFSVIFSTSIIFELRNIVNGFTLGLLSVFIVLFLIQNEVFKVKEIRKVFAGNKNSLLPFSITFIISITLASIGMYFFTNKATEIKDNSELNKNIELNKIDEKYHEKTLNLQSLSYDNTPEYENLNTELKYWKRVSAATLAERDEIRNRIDKLQNLINTNRTNFEVNKSKELSTLNTLIESEKNIVLAQYNNSLNKTNKNNFITYIFLSLILITEFSTIILNKNIVEKRNILDQFVNSRIAKTYLVASNLLTSLYISNKNNWVNINNAKYSYANKDNVLDWDEIKRLYNNFISLGILSEGEIRKEGDKELLYNELVLNENDAHSKLDEYFERFFRVL